MDAKAGGVAVLVALVGETTDFVTPAQDKALRSVAEDLLRHLRRMARHTEFAVVTLARTACERAVADVFGSSGCRVWAPAGAAALGRAQAGELPTDFCGMQSEGAAGSVEALCRYAHIVVDISPAVPAADSFRAQVVSACLNQTFRFGDDNIDDEQLVLLDPPTAPAVVTLKLPPANGFAKKPRRADLTRIDEIPELVALLTEIDRLNVHVTSVSKAKAEDRKANLRRKSGIENKPEVEDADPALGFVLDRFGRASASARAAKEGVDRFNYFYAVALALAVIVYELLNDLLSIRGPALLFYLVLMGTTVVLALIMGARRVHETMLASRMLAEILRAQLFWRLCGVDSRLETTIRRWAPGEWLVRAQGTEKEATPRRWTPDVSLIAEHCARAIDFSIALAGPPRQSDPHHFGHIWILTQIEYHGEYSVKHARRAEQLEWLQGITIVIAVGLAFGLLATQGQFSTLEAMAMSGLPAIAGGIAIVRERFSYRSLSENYARMYRLSVSALRKLEQANTDRARVIVQQFGRETIKEGIEWRQVHRLRPADARSAIGG